MRRARQRHLSFARLPAFFLRRQQIPDFGLIEYFARISECIDSGGKPAVDGSLQQRFLNLLETKPAAHASTYERFHFVGQAQCHQDADIDQTSFFMRQTRPVPDLTQHTREARSIIGATSSLSL
jgi:hypothetical protein